MNSTVLRVTLLGAPALSVSPSLAQPVSRKAAGLLAYLAIEGETGRGTVAGLLWPEAREATSRNNLAQTIRRLRSVAQGQEWLGGGERLMLTAAVEVDVAQVGTAYRAHRHQEVAAQPLGRLLADYDYSDCEDFDAWLHGERERVDAIRRESLIALIRHLEHSREYRLAVGYARSLVDLDPCREESHRHLMRLYSLLGDRAAALKAYHFCQSVLRRELGLAPMPETAGLAHAIEHETPSSARAGAEAAAAARPLLVERAAAWQTMENAWARHQAVFIVGEVGVGKTRLMQEFLATKGGAVLVDARPEDQGTPYATLSRAYRELLAATPALALPAWAVGELAHLLPELEPPAPEDAHGAGKLRLLRAQLALLQEGALAGVGCLAVDDLQCADTPSLEALLALVTERWGRPDGMRAVFCLRSGALVPHLRQALNALVGRGEAVVVEPGPLSLAGARRLLPEMGLNAEAIHRYSGGNPALMLALATTWEDRAEPALDAAARAVLRARLAPLSPRALDLARIAAAAGQRVELGLASRILEVNPLTLVDAWQELEGFGLLAGGVLMPPALAQMVRQELPPDLVRLIATGCDVEAGH